MFLKILGGYIISVLSMYEEHQKLLKEHDAKIQADNGWAQKNKPRDLLLTFHFVKAF